MADQPPVDPSQPAAGGWVPTPKERALGTVAVAVLGSLAPVLITQIPGPVGIITACVAGALAAGIAAVLGMQSAGPRTGL